MSGKRKLQIPGNPYAKKRKVTPERRHELVQIFLNMGHDIARAECAASGVEKYYAEKQASEMGYQIPRKPRVMVGRVEA